MKAFLLFLGIVIILGLVFWFETFKYHECKAVGHSTTYCVLMVNSK